MASLTPERIAALAAEIYISPELQAEHAVYERRLSNCRSCDALRGDVLCAYCGCFIQFRARGRNSCCPCPEGDRW